MSPSCSAATSITGRSGPIGRSSASASRTSRDGSAGAGRRSPPTAPSCASTASTPTRSSGRSRCACTRPRSRAWRRTTCRSSCAWRSRNVLLWAARGSSLRGRGKVMNRFARFVVAASIVTLGSVAALHAQDGSAKGPATAADASRYSLEGTLLEGGGRYSGALLLERCKGDEVRARFALSRSGSLALARQGASGQLAGKRLVLRWTSTSIDTPGLADLGKRKGPKAVESSFEAVYDLDACTGTVSRDGRPCATERLARLELLKEPG